MSYLLKKIKYFLKLKKGPVSSLKIFTDIGKKKSFIRKINKSMSPLSPDCQIDITNDIQ